MPFLHFELGQTPKSLLDSPWVDVASGVDNATFCRDATLCCRRHTRNLQGRGPEWCKEYDRRVLALPAIKREAPATNQLPSIPSLFIGPPFYAPLTRFIYPTSAAFYASISSSADSACSSNASSCACAQPSIRPSSSHAPADPPQSLLVTECITLDPRLGDGGLVSATTAPLDPLLCLSSSSSRGGQHVPDSDPPSDPGPYPRHPAAADKNSRPAMAEHFLRSIGASIGLPSGVNANQPDGIKCLSVEELQLQLQAQIQQNCTPTRAKNITMSLWFPLDAQFVLPEQDMSNQPPQTVTAHDVVTNQQPGDDSSQKPVAQHIASVIAAVDNSQWIAKDISPAPRGLQATFMCSQSLKHWKQQVDSLETKPVLAECVHMPDDDILMRKSALILMLVVHFVTV